ncbi:MAG TPA: HAMP domain-containing protein, partial [Candidatus Omnitrophota bacterium]|nr:HAMP domain-containing protein [Candidatus Omnitrophota bacterium]
MLSEETLTGDRHMSGRLRDATISEQLYALAGVVFVGFALVLGGWLHTRSIQDDAFDRHMAELADLREAVALDFWLLKARYFEKEFLIRPDEKYVGDMDVPRKHLLEALAEMKTAHPDGLMAGVRSYFAHWDAFTAGWRELGMAPDGGLRGRLAERAADLSSRFAAIVAARAEAEDEEVEKAIGEVRRLEVELRLRADRAGLDEAQASVAKLRGLLERSPHLHPAERTGMVAATEAFTAQLAPAGDLMLRLSADATKFKEFYAPAKKGIDAIIAANAAEQEQARKEYEAARRFGTFAMLVTAIPTVILVTTMALISARLLSGRVKVLSARMSAVADGDLEGHVPFAEGRSEISVMARALAVFRENALSLA